MNRAFCIVIAVLFVTGVSAAIEMSLQSGTAGYSKNNFSTIYAGMSYYPDYLGATPLRPEAGLGFWRAERQFEYAMASSSFLDFAPSPRLKREDRGMFGDVRLAMDFERIAQREGNPVWPVFGAGLLLDWVESTPIELRYLLFGRMSVRLTNAASLFAEVEGHTENFDHWFENDEGLDYIMKFGCKFRAF